MGRKHKLCREKRLKEQMQQTNTSNNHDTDYNVEFYKDRGLIFEFSCPGNIPK